MNKYIIVKCKVNNKYSFLKKIENINVDILNIRYLDKYIIFKTKKEHFNKLKKYLPSYNFVIINHKKKIFKNKELVLSLIIGIVLFLIISNLTINIKILHEDVEIRNLLKEELDSYGIKPLYFKKTYQELQNIKQNIKEKYPDKIDWLEFEYKGMKLIVRVEKRIITKNKLNNSKCNIVAKKEGMISGIKIIEGVANVSLYENVKKDDILISGIIMHNNSEVARVCAKGEIYANTWYKVKVKIPFKYITYKKTGRKKYNIVFANKNNKTKILKNRFNSFKSEYKRILKIFDYELLLEKEIEQEKTIKKYSQKEALNNAIKKATINLKKTLSNKDKIIDKKVLKKSINNSTMDVEVFIIANEQIGTLIRIDDKIEGTDSNDTSNN